MLLERLADSHDPTRQEAIVALAIRQDGRVLASLEAELANHGPTTAVLEAVRAYPHGRLIPALEALLQETPADAELVELLRRCRDQEATDR